MIRNLAFAFVLTASALSAQSTLFLHDSGLDQLFSVDPATGAATLIGSTLVGGVGPGTPAGLAWDGINLYTLDLGGGALWTVDPVTALCTQVGTSGISGWQDITWDPVTLQFFAVNQSNTLYAIDLLGNATLIGSTPAGPLLTAMAVDSLGQLWAMNFFSPGELGTLDRATAAFTPVVTTNLSGVQGMDFDPTTGQLYAADTNLDSLHIIDVATGAVTTIGPNGAGVAFAKSLRFAGGSVMIPASLTPIGLGCVGSNGLSTLAGEGGQLPQIGNGTFAFEFSQAAPNSTAYFFYAAFAQAQTLQASGSCYVHLDVPSLFAFINAGINPVAVPTDALGVALLSSPIPSDPAFAGASFGLQALAIDPGTPRGFTLSNGLQVLLGF